MTEAGALLLPTLLLAIAAFFFLQRRKIATVESNFLGGRVSPGCVVAEAIFLALLALAFLALYHSGYFRE